MKRVRVLEFIRDFDKLRCGLVLKTLFRRALDLCGFELSQDQLLTLEQRYIINVTQHVQNASFSIL